MGWGTLADDAEVESDTGLKTQAQPLAKNANLSSSSHLLTCGPGGTMARSGFNAAATSKQHFPSPASGAGGTAQAGRRGEHRRNRQPKEGSRGSGKSSAPFGQRPRRKKRLGVRYRRTVPGRAKIWNGSTAGDVKTEQDQRDADDPAHCHRRREPDNPDPCQAPAEIGQQ